MDFDELKSRILSLLEEYEYDLQHPTPWPPAGCIITGEGDGIVGLMQTEPTTVPTFAGIERTYPSWMIEKDN